MRGSIFVGNIRALVSNIPTVIGCLGTKSSIFSAAKVV